MPILAVKINDEDVIVTRKEVKDYVEDEEFLYYLNVYQTTKLWGLPNGSGWANEPSDIIMGISALELEAKRIESEHYEKKSNGAGKLGLKSQQV